MVLRGLAAEWRARPTGSKVEGRSLRHSAMVHRPEAMLAATDNRDLNERAYQSELVETKDVIEAQIMESLWQAQFHKVLYDHVETRAHLNFLVGKEMTKFLEEKGQN